MGARDRLTVWVVAEMLALKMLFEVAATRESLLAISGRQIFVPEAVFLRRFPHPFIISHIMCVLHTSI